MAWEIRRTRPEEIEEIMAIYAHARAFMAEQGNPKQWGESNWPPRDLVEEDIATGKSYVAEQDGRIGCVFFYDYGADVESTYTEVEGGRWLDDSPYGVVHRIASSHVAPGAGTASLLWAIEQAGGHLRIDTHADNIPMQQLLGKLGFSPIGTIYVYAERLPRLAFEAYEHVQEV